MGGLNARHLPLYVVGHFVPAAGEVGWSARACGKREIVGHLAALYVVLLV